MSKTSKTFRTSTWATAVLLGLVAGLPARADGYLYFTDNAAGTISRVNLNSLALPETVVSGLHSPFHLVVDATSMYWADNVDNAIYMAPVNVISPAVTSLALVGSPEGVAIDGTYIYWSEPSDINPPSLGRVQKSDLLTDFSETWLTTTNDSNLSYPRGVAVDGSHIYWADAGATPGIYWDSLGATPVPVGSVVLQSYSDPYGLVVNPSFMYWTDNDDGGLGDPILTRPQIGQATIPGGVQTTPPWIGIGTYTGTTPNYDGFGEGITVANDIYYCDSANGVIWKTSLDGSATPTPFVSGLVYPIGVTTTNAPLVITLDAFNAAYGANNQVNLTWTTGSEEDNAGFNVYRSADATTGFVKLTSQLIPSKATFPGGASYAWTDTTATPGQTFFYKLEDLDTHNVSTLHGPISAHTGPSAIQSFQASPSTIFRGGTATLSWTANGATGLTLGGAGLVTGNSVLVQPAGATSYTLFDAAGDLSLTTVTVRTFTAADMPGLAKAWGTKAGDAAFDPAYDMNGDGKIDDADVALLVHN